MSDAIKETSAVLKARKAFNDALTLKADQTRATWFPISVMILLMALPLLQFTCNYNYILHRVLLIASMIARLLFDQPPTELSVQWAKLPYYYAMLAIAAFTVWCSYRITHSKFGLGLRAISKDEIKAEAAGIDTRFYKVAAFALSAFFVGMTGAVWGE